LNRINNLKDIQYPLHFQFMIKKILLENILKNKNTWIIIFYIKKIDPTPRITQSNILITTN
jgi:hypothetical protein